MVSKTIPISKSATAKLIMRKLLSSPTLVFPSVLERCFFRSDLTVVIITVKLPAVAKNIINQINTFNTVDLINSSLEDTALF